MSRNLQAAADNAAYAGAIERTQGSDNSTITAVAKMAAQLNGYSGNNSTVNPAATTSGGAPAVEVVLRRDVDRFFTSAFQSGKVGLTARAVASVGADAPNSNCVLALDSGSSTSVTLSGNADLTVRGCSLASNSTASPAVSVSGAATLRADCVEAMGPVSLGSRTTLAACSGPVRRSAPVSDPYGTVPEPTPSGLCLPNTAAVLLPGRYCGGLDLKGTVNLLPGVYYISGGDFSANANARITGTGVTIFLDGGAGIKVNGNAQLNLSAPTSGSTQGILFFGDRQGNGDATFNGNGSSTFVGAFYLPGQSLNFSGNTSVDVSCTRMVARTMRWTGTGTVDGTCQNSALNHGTGTSSRVMLVE